MAAVQQSDLNSESSEERDHGIASLSEAERYTSSTEDMSREELELSKEYAEMIVNTIRESLLVLDLELRVKSASRSFYDTFKVRREETEGKPIYELGNGQWDIPQLRELLEEILPKSESFDDFEVEHDFEEIGRRVMLLNARRLDHRDMILLAIEDVTEREALKALNDTLEKRIEERTREVRTLASTLTMAEQQERRRISRVLHDDLQQLLYAIQMKMVYVRQGAESGDREQLEINAGDVEKWLGTAIETTRRLTVDLSPPILKGEGLVDALRWLARQMKEVHGLEVEIMADHVFHMDYNDVRVLLFQIVRELLFNVVKHAETRAATIEIRQLDHYFLISVSDEGCGFDVNEAALRSDTEPGGGFGLFSVRERLALFGGHMEIESSPGRGTRVAVYTLATPELSGREDGASRNE